ncbi:putative RNA polymerase II nuclear localization protein SLC7A6OS [Mantella aurantiaca]
MDAAVLRVKRKRGADPAEALIISCKRIRTEEEDEKDQVTKQLFRLAATVTSQDEPIQKYVHDAMSRDRAAQAFHPSIGSLQRIQKELRAVKETERQESRYRVISHLRPACDDQESAAGSSPPPSPVTEQKPEAEKAEASACPNPHSPVRAPGSFQVFDMVQEEAEKGDAALKESDPGTITCNSVKMIRERLTVSDEGLGSEHRENPEEFVYDIYYAEASPHNWIQDILSVKPYKHQEQDLVPDDPEPEEIYDDEDDENEESNWRNDYPDEEDEDNSDREERYMGYYEDSDEENGHRRDPWKAYKQMAMRELDEDEDDD